MPTVDDPTPRSGTRSPIKLIGLTVLGLLILAIILLALGVFNFEQSGWF